MTSFFNIDWIKSFEGDPPDDAVIRTDIFENVKIKYAVLDGVIWVMEINKLEDNDD